MFECAVDTVDSRFFKIALSRNSKIANCKILLWNFGRKPNEKRGKGRRVDKFSWRS
jgi:hypothetical protein